MINFFVDYVFGKVLDKLLDLAFPSKVMASDQIINLNISVDNNIVIMGNGKHQVIDPLKFREKLTTEEARLFSSFLEIIAKRNVQLKTQGGEHKLYLSGKITLKEALTYDQLYKKAVLRQEKIPVESFYLDSSLKKIVKEESIKELMNSKNIVLHSLTQPKKLDVQLKVKNVAGKKTIYSERITLSGYDYDSEQIILGNHLSTDIIQVFIVISRKYPDFELMLDFKDKEYFTTQELRHINNIERFLVKDKTLQLVIESNDNQQELISGIYRVDDSFIEMYREGKKEFIDLLEKIERYFSVTLQIPPIEKFTNNDWEVLQQLRLAFDEKSVQAKVSGPVKLRLTGLQPEIQKTFLRGNVKVQEVREMKLFNSSLKGIKKIICFTNIKEKGATSREPLKFRERGVEYTDITFYVYGDGVCTVKYVLPDKK